MTVGNDAYPGVFAICVRLRATTLVKQRNTYGLTFLKFIVYLSLLARISEYGISYIIAKIYGNCIAHHLFYIRFCTFKAKILRKGLNHTTLP